MNKVNCNGCILNFYNKKDSECPNFKSAKLQEAVEIEKDAVPPFDISNLKTKPNCYKDTTNIRIRLDHLTSDGYWKY